MIIGIPKEIKFDESRVGMTPAGVYELFRSGHQIIVENNAGLSVGYDNQSYIDAGATIVSDLADVYQQSQMIVKVNPPDPREYQYIKEKQIIFSSLHLCINPELAQALLESDCIAIAYETVTNDANQLPLLSPMSEVAGKLSVQAGAVILQKENGGAGILLGGVPGVKAANVVIIGGGVAGLNAARVASGMGADVTILDRNIDILKKIDNDFQGRIKTVYSNQLNIEKAVRGAHLVICAVLNRGAAAPKLLSRSLIREMKNGSVIVDITIDQGGSCETSMPTTLQKPTYEIDGVIHYCVTNMPGAVAKTSTLALTNATLPFVTEIASKGWKNAVITNKHIMNGLHICLGNVTYEAVARDLGYHYVDPKSLL
ncbi:MAG: alanine dehydrogenase [Burkholderiales bacterium]|nr:alanine dehydrogenase [Burkholderiales bacterium]